MTHDAIVMDHVWKRYLLGQGGGARGVLRRALGRGPGRAARWSLHDLTLAVKPGESVGLIGANGAGKSTALKLIAGISRPTRGHVATSGRVASLINVGAGFHPELTGRENVQLNGVILGLTRRQVRDRYDAIVDFAGLAPFMDTPVKFYSTGMYARLAFSVAVHVEPRVLLVDEVLSVGDAGFQDRSLRRMLTFRDRGTAIVFVSHNLAAVEVMCQRALWLDRGAVRANGPVADVVRAYLDAVDDADAPTGERHVTVAGVEVLDASGRRAGGLAGDQPFLVRASGRIWRELAEPVFVVTIRGDDGPLFAGNMHIDGNWPSRMPVGPFVAECAFGAPCLLPGEYRVEIKIKQNVRTNYFEPRVLGRFTVLGPAGRGGGDVPPAWRIEPQLAPRAETGGESSANVAGLCRHAKPGAIIGEH